jgi:membrane-associated phospholipid phosphatase
MWAYKVAFEVPYDRPERLRARLQIDTPIAIDQVLGLGLPPGQRLQRRLRHPPQLSGLDKALTAVYLLWEIEPHAALAYLLWRHPTRFRRGALRLAATFDATLVGYFAVPTAPPWWASEIEGRMNGDVRRVTAELLRGLKGQARPGIPNDHVAGANPWAAWPSDHFGSALMAAILLAEVSPRLGCVAGAYAAALAFALVYCGEHYVIDLVLGAAVAIGIDRVASS